MSRTARVVIAGIVTAGALVVGAGAAFADEPGDGRHDDGSKGSKGTSSEEKAPSADTSSEEAGGAAGGDMLGGLLGSLPIGL